MSHSRIFEAPLNMMQCTVVEKIGQCLSFELFRESDNEFLLACTMDKTGNGSLLFSTFQDSHRRRYEDMVILLQEHPSYVAKLSRDWLSGLTFVLLDKNEIALCEIK